MFHEAIRHKLTNQPTSNLHLWTPISSSSQRNYPNNTYPSGSSYPTYPTALSPNIAPSNAPHQTRGPVFTGGPLKQPPPIQHEDSSDSSSSGETVTARTATPSALRFFSQKASESLRYLATREEEHKARDKGELQDELKGKRIWRVGGIGVCCYSLEEEDEQKKMEVWREWAEKHEREDWANSARDRTRVYNKGG